MSTLALPFIIGSSLFLQDKSLDGFEIRQDWTKVCRVSYLWTSEKISIDLWWEKCCEHSSAFIFDWILFTLAGNKDNHESLNEFQFLPDPITNFALAAWAFEKWLYCVIKSLAPSFFDWILFILACNKESYKSLDGTKIRQDMTRVYGVSCPWTSEKYL